MYIQIFQNKNSEIFLVPRPSRILNLLSDFVGIPCLRVAVPSCKILA
jgi:hypothetical protein